MTASRSIENVAIECGLELEPTPSGFKARCTQHDDEQASLYLDTTKELWYCFGCSRGGDAAALCRFLGFSEDLAVDPEAEPLPLPPPNIAPPTHQDLGRRFCALSTLIAAGLVDRQLLRDLDAAVVQERDDDVRRLLDEIEGQVLLTGAAECAML